MSLEVFVADEQSTEPVDISRWRLLAEKVLTAQGIRGEAELNVLYVDEVSIASLNERFLGHEGPTDVLSFPIEDDIAAGGMYPGPFTPGPWSSGPGRQAFEDDVEIRRPGTGSPGDAPLLLGDVVICPSVAKRNAPEHAGDYESEMALLLVHGILHLLGMDHMEDDDAEEMEALERQLLATHHRQDT